MGYIIIGAISLYSMIFPSPIVDDYHVIGQGVYHLEGTTWIDDGWGRVVIAAHNPGKFSALPQLAVGDEIILLSRNETQVWIVYERLIVQDDLHHLNPTPSFTLTLITCLDRGNTWLVVNAYPMVQSQHH